MLQLMDSQTTYASLIGNNIRCIGSPDLAVELQELFEIDSTGLLVGQGAQQLLPCPLDRQLPQILPLTLLAHINAQLL